MIKILYAALSTLGFGMVFHANKNKLLYIMIGGLLNYLAYYVTYKYTSSDFLSSVSCSFVVSCYAFFMARIIKCPASIFIFTGLIPSVPGGTLFYTMQNIVLGNSDLANKYAVVTVEIIFGIVSGILLWSTISSLLLHIKTKYVKKVKTN